MTDITNAEFIADARGPDHVATDCILFLHEALDRLEKLADENARLKKPSRGMTEEIQAVMAATKSALEQSRSRGIVLEAEIARLRGDSEALRLLREMNMNRHGGIYDLGVTILDGETTWMLFDAKDPFEPFSQGDTPLEAILKAKSAIEHEQEEA